jgi:hypothetical protein
VYTIGLSAGIWFGTEPPTDSRRADMRTVEAAMLRDRGRRFGNPSGPPVAWDRRRLRRIGVVRASHARKRKEARKRVARVTHSRKSGLQIGACQTARGGHPAGRDGCGVWAASRDAIGNAVAAGHRRRWTVCCVLASRAAKRAAQGTGMAPDLASPRYVDQCIDSPVLRGEALDGSIVFPRIVATVWPTGHEHG